jgi:hypothetical protein
MPPSAIKGTPVLLDIDLQLIIAVNWGMPAPAMIRVVHIDPGPIPIFTPSTPALTRFSAPFAVLTLPAISSIFLKLLFNVFTASITFFVSP